MSTYFEELNEYTADKLKIKLEQDTEFKEEFMELIGFYSAKLYQFIPEGDSREEFDEYFFNMAKSQYFQGYQIMIELLNDDTTKLSEDFLSQPKGGLKNEVPRLLKTALEEVLQETVKTEGTKKLVMWLITRFEDIYDIVNQTVLELTYMGAYLAIQEEKQKRGLTIQNESSDLLLGNVSDLIFLTPQLYMIPTYVVVNNEDVLESWDIIWWSAISNDKAGEITIIQSSQEYQEFNLKISLQEQIREKERENIISYLIQTLQNQSENKKTITVTNYIVKEITQLTV